MSRRRCARQWEAAAVEDGRFVGADRVSFERHRDTCRTCTEEVEALAALRRTMKTVGPAEWTALDVRRMRQALLREAHLRPTRREAPRRWPVVLAVVGIGLPGPPSSSRASPAPP